MASAAVYHGYITNWLEALGRKTTAFITAVGSVLIFFGQTLRGTFSRPLQVRSVLKQMELIGFNSIPVVL